MYVTHAIQISNGTPQLAPDLTPARFGLAQTLVIKGELGQALGEIAESVAEEVAARGKDESVEDRM